MTGKKNASPDAKTHSERRESVPGFKPMKPRPYGALKSVVLSAVDQAGGVDQVGTLLQRSPKTVYCYTDPREDTDMSLEQARMVTRYLGATAFAEDFAALAGGSFVPGEGAGEKSISEYTVIANRGVTNLVALLVAALEDGRIDDAERAALLPVVDDLHRDITSLRNRLRGNGAKGDRNVNS